MTKEYQVEGMTCGSCKARVEQVVAILPEVTSAEVDLTESKLTIESGGVISIKKLQSALPDKFSISESASSKPTKPASQLSQLFPLFLIFGYITITATLLNQSSWSGREFMLDFMGLFYVVFSFFKLLDLKGFPESFQMYDPLAKMFPIYGWIYPFIEVALGLMFLNRIAVPSVLITTIVILGITTVGVTKTLFSKKTIQCACLGTALKLPMTKATFIENSIMLAMAVVMLAA